MLWMDHCPAQAGANAKKAAKKAARAEKKAALPAKKAEALDAMKRSCYTAHGDVHMINV